MKDRREEKRKEEEEEEAIHTEGDSILWAARVTTYENQVNMDDRNRFSVLALHTQATAVSCGIVDAIE